MNRTTFCDATTLSKVVLSSGVRAAKQQNDLNFFERNPFKRAVLWRSVTRQLILPVIEGQRQLETAFPLAMGGSPWVILVEAKTTEGWAVLNGE